jgi:hypothetical protein
MISTKNYDIAIVDSNNGPTSQLASGGRGGLALYHVKKLPTMDVEEVWLYTETMNLASHGCSRQPPPCLVLYYGNTRVYIGYEPTPESYTIGTSIQFYHVVVCMCISVPSPVPHIYRAC